MKKYKIEFEQFIDLPIKDVFLFFSQPKNLSLITPARLKFNVLTPEPIEMKEGQLIDYTLTIMYIINIRWTTLITMYKEPNVFIDQQLKGPYSLWHHTHTFEEKDEGTLIKDKVIYGVPFGWVGRFLHFIYIKYDVNSIFKYRHQILKKIFLEIKEQSR